MKRKRLLLYVFFDRDGIIDDYVVYQLEQMKTQVDKIVMICQGGVLETETLKVEQLVNKIIIRENTGYDAGAWKECILEYLGWDEINPYDDLILMNDSCYGPIFPISELFEKMDSRNVDFWGITEHFRMDNRYGMNPYDYFPDHIQSYFVCFRENVHRSDVFKAFWDELGDTDLFEESVSYFETVFTKYLEDRGFSWGVYTDTSKDRQDSLNNANPTLFNIDELLIEQRNPFIKKKHMLSRLDSYLNVMDSTQAKTCLTYIDEHTDYDVKMIYRNIIRLGYTRELYELYHWDYILPEDVQKREHNDKKIALVIHLYYEEQFDFCHRYMESMPEYSDIYITVADADKAGRIRALFSDIECNNLEVRLVDNKGMDISALLIGARDIFLDDYDYVCFIHDKMSLSKTINRRAGEGFRDCMFNCMLKSKEYVQNLLDVFENEPFLGLLAPPYPMSGIYKKNFGKIWLNNFEGTVEIAEKLDLNCNFDPKKDPIALGTTFWCRPEALQKLFAYPWSYDDFEENFKKREGDFLHCIERIFEYVAQDKGYYTGVSMPISYAQTAYSVENYMLYKELRRSRELARRVKKLDKKNKALEKKLSSIKGSKSWRYTRWLRRK